MGERLDPATFRLPVERIRDGWYSDAYFVSTKQLLEDDGRHPQVLVQVFQKRDSLLGGIDEAIAILKLCAGRRDGDGTWLPGWDALEVRALHEGDRVAPHEAVMTIAGDYTLFAHLETVYLGTLARRSLIMRNVREVVEAARGKQIFYFPARHDHWLVQTGDGWAAHVAGAIGVSTEAQASWWGGRGIGTVPHGLIAAYGGDTVLAATRFADRFHPDVNVTVLVDWDNDSVRTALEVAAALGERLWGVRLDTGEQLVDRALWEEMGSFKPTGVNPRLVEKVRGALDAAGFGHVRIVASGGFDAERIRAFEADAVPVDAYGVGSSLIRGQNDYTADVVRVDGAACAKVGRGETPNPRLERVAQRRAGRSARAGARYAPPRMLGRIDHIGVAVEDLDAALQTYAGGLGMPVVHRETVTEQGVEAILLDVGEGHVELLAPLAADTPVGRYLARKGPGLHHVAYQVGDIEATLASLKASGLRLIDETPRIGIRGSRVAFVHPAATGGVLTEIVQPAEGH